MSAPIVIIAAMPEELVPLIKRLQNARKTSVGRFTAWHGTLVGRHVCLLRSGMGERNAREAVTTILKHLHPTAIYTIGFGGAIRSGLAIGDLVLGKGLFFFNGMALVPVSPLASVAVSDDFLQHNLVAGSILTTRQIVSKTAADHHLPVDLPHPVLDMETATIATLASQAGVPILALRAISDPADEELTFSLEEFCDREFNLQLWRVLLTVAKKPWIIPQLLRLSRNCRRAGIALADGVCELLTDAN